MVEIELLGGLAVRTDEGEAIDVGSPKCQALLAGLALSVGQAVPFARLVEIVWGEDPPRTAQKTLQSYLTRLRSAVGPDLIVRTGSAYCLAIDPQSVDVHRFQRHLDDDEVDLALAEWTGEPLAGLDTVGLDAVVGGLVERWLGATETSLARRIESDSAEAIGSLTTLTKRYPYREGLWALRMTALYRVGRQADALAAFREARRHLVDDLGVEPGPRLRELEAMILGQDTRLDTVEASARPARGLPTGTVTFGISDIVGSTRLWATDRQAMPDVLELHDRLVTGAADRHDGHVFSTGGDSFTVAFHGVSQALSWADDVHGSLAAQDWPVGLDVRVRIGLHTGEAEERRGNYFGPAVNLTARIAAIGSGGQTLLSDVTASLAGSADLTDLGTVALPDIAAPQRIMQVGRAEHPSLRTQSRQRGNLPNRLPRLIGRHDDVDRVGRALRESSLVTLVGPGGIGKTRLALAVAHEAVVSADVPCWFVDLAAITASTDVSQAVADATGARPGADRNLVESVVAWLESSSCILLLDNCEHVLDGAARMARAIVEGCPNVKVLATSREGLADPDERLVAVPPLDAGGSSIDLFAERARAVDPDFDLESSRPQVAEICRRLDGVPLAIELAAARSRSLTPTDLLDRLDDHLRLLGSGGRNTIERHRTLRATIEWSYDLLTAAEQTLFQRLSVFAGPFDLAAAAAVASDQFLDSVDVDDLIGSLVDRSMITVESGPFGRQFRFLETMRQFGIEHLAGSGETDRITQRHAHWCLTQVNAIGDLLAGTREIEGVNRTAELWPNLRAAVDWAANNRNLEFGIDLILPVAMEMFCRSRSEIGVWAERLLDVAPAEADSEALIDGASIVAVALWTSQDLAGFARLLARNPVLDDPRIQWLAALTELDYDRAYDLAHLAASRTEKRGHTALALWIRGGAAFALIRRGELDRHDAETLAIIEALGPDNAALRRGSLISLGMTALFRNDPVRAQEYFDEMLALGTPTGTASIFTAPYAMAAFERGETLDAFRLLRAGIADLLESRTLLFGALTSTYFIKMMASSHHLPELARAVGYHRASVHQQSPHYAPLVDGAIDYLTTNLDPLLEREEARGRELGDEEALSFMRDALDTILADDLG